MKVNLKKIGAIVAGATILASSAAFAGLMFGSTTLVDNNGAPVAKVVVGSNAAPSDGVAAALIAGKMVSEAYKSQTLTAQVSGSAACVSGNGSASAGTCPVSNESVRLEITVPGSVASGTWVGNNLIGDYLDRTLWDRLASNTTNDVSSYTFGSGDTSESANPFTDGNGSNIGRSETMLYRVSGDVFNPFANFAVNDADAGVNYVEKQYIWLAGDNHYDQTKDTTVGTLDFLAYSLKFDGPGTRNMGIPVCTRAESLNFAACKDTTGDTTIDDATETHRVKVSFLGEEWIISDMEAPSSTASTETLVVPGGSIKLAKEAKEGILNQGENLQLGDLRFQLDDLEAHGDSGVSAIFSVLDANGNILKKDKVGAGATKDFDINGHKFRLHVYKIAPGYTFGAKWADVAIYDKELTLTSGQELSQDDDSNPEYKVLLGWKNRDATSAADDIDTLRSIVIYSDSIDDLASGGEQNMRPGEYVNLVQDPAVWRLTYRGLDLTSSDRQNLKFEIQTSTKTIAASDGPLDGATQMTCKIFAPYLKVSSSKTNTGVFEVVRSDGAGSGTLSDSEFLVPLNAGATADSVAAGQSGQAAICDTDNDNDLDGSDTPVAALFGGAFMRESRNGDYGYATNPSGGLFIDFSDAGDGVSDFAPGSGGQILIEWPGDVAGLGDNALGDMFNSTGSIGGDYDILSSTTTPTLLFGVAEKAGTGSSNSYVDYFVFAVARADTGTPNDATFDFDAQDNDTTFLYQSSDNKILYGHATQNAVNTDNSLEYYGTGTGTKLSGPVDSGMEMVEEGYTSERGSTFDSISTKSVNFKIANKLGHAQWMLAPVSNTTSSTSGQVRTLREGESTTVSGVTVKVLEISETVGACSAAGASVSCTADMSGVGAMIMPNNAPSVTVAMPYTGNYDNLVVLDSDAVGVNTLVSVGGDKVNSVTRSLMEGSSVDWSATPKVVREVVQGSKIVVAGKDATDTLDAAKDFVAQVRKTQ